MFEVMLGNEAAPTYFSMELGLNGQTEETLRFNISQLTGTLTLDTGETVSFTSEVTQTQVSIVAPSTARKLFCQFLNDEKPITGKLFSTTANTRIVSVNDWSEMGRIGKLQFQGSAALTTVPNTSPKTKDYSQMFLGCTVFNSDIRNWDVTHVSSTSNMFANCSEFNQPLNNWNVSNIKNIVGMFFKCSKFNQPLNNWSVGHITDMSSVFANCFAFNQPLNNWNVSKVTNMRNMFYGCLVFNQPLNNWNVSNVTVMTMMFYASPKFNQNLSGLTFPLVTLANRSQYDTGATAWLTGNKPNFALKT